MANQLLFIIVIILLEGFVNLQAQHQWVVSPPGYNFIYSHDAYPKNTEGSPYLVDDWQPADIIFKDGKAVAGLLVRYNVLQGRLMYKYNNTTYVVGEPDSISEMRLPDKVFVYRKFIINKKDTGKSFFEVIVDGKASLLNRYKIEMIPSNYNAALDFGSKNTKLIMKQQLYVQLGEKIVILDKKKQLLEILQDKKEEVFKYMKKERLSFKNKEDMIKVIKYYNLLFAKPDGFNRN